MVERRWNIDGGRLQLSDGRCSPGADAAAGPRRSARQEQEHCQNVIALPNGDMLEADVVGFSRLGPNGSRRWVQKEQDRGFQRLSGIVLRVSADGARVGFDYEIIRHEPGALRHGDADADPRTWRRFRDDLVPRQTGLPVKDWQGSLVPTLDGKALGLWPYERSRSLAVDPSGKSFVLGTSVAFARL